MSLRKSSYQLALCLAASASLALPAQAGLDDQAPSSRVANANKAKECDFPPVVYVSGCTGTLVHPKIVVYAWHCGKPKSVKFTESGRSGGGFSVPATCKTYSGGTTNAKDWAYCLLSEPVTDVPIVPVVAGCEYEMISKGGQEVVQVGFGKTHNSAAGTKHWGISEVTSVKNGVVTVGDKNSVVACPGDSGGPLMVRMEDKSWRTIGILSTYNGKCGAGGVNWYADAYTALSWIEKDSGVDITPCFDADGNWEPGPDCGGFYAGNPGEPSGNWGNKCEGTPKSGRSSTCGPAGDSGGAESTSGGGDEESGNGDDGGDGDATGPETTIVSPKDGARFDEDESIKVLAKASGDAKISSIELFVDGKSKGTKKKAPFRWTIKGLSSGEFELIAIAKDEDGNSGTSEVTTIIMGDAQGDGDNGEDSQGGDASNETEDGDTDSDGSQDSDNNSGESSSANASGKEDDEKGGCAVDANRDAGLIGFALALGLLGLRRRRD